MEGFLVAVYSLEYSNPDNSISDPHNGIPAILLSGLSFGSNYMVGDGDFGF